MSLEKETKNLMELVKKLTDRVTELKLKGSQSDSDSENTYYEKWQRVSQENLVLKNKIAELETQLSVATFELEKRNSLLLKAGLQVK